MSATKKPSARKDVYQIVTDKMLEALDKDIMPWRKPWTTRNGKGTMHRNLLTKKPYRGINPFLLELEAMTQGFSSPYWVTFKQASQVGIKWTEEAKATWLAEHEGEELPKTQGHVRKGEKSTLIVFFKRTSYKPKAGQTCTKCYKGKYKSDMTCDSCGKQAPAKQASMILNYYRVFNVEQCENVEIPAAPKPEDKPEVQALDQADEILNGMIGMPRVQYGQTGAWYSPAQDSIGMPDRSEFHSSEAFYSTLFHENVHATGHADRLARKKAFVGSFGSQEYAHEELVAEMGASMLCAMAGIENELDQAAAYIRHWLSKADYAAALKKDKRLVVIAAAQAQKAADFILGEHQGNENEGE